MATSNNPLAPGPETQIDSPVPLPDPPQEDLGAPVPVGDSSDQGRIISEEERESIPPANLTR